LVSNLNLPLYGCTKEILKIIAATQIKHVFLNPRSERMGENKLHVKFACQEGDVITTVLNVTKAFEQQVMPQQFYDKLENSFITVSSFFFL